MCINFRYLDREVTKSKSTTSILYSYIPGYLFLSIPGYLLVGLFENFHFLLNCLSSDDNVSGRNSKMCLLLKFTQTMSIA